MRRSHSAVRWNRLAVLLCFVLGVAVACSKDLVAPRPAPRAARRDLLPPPPACDDGFVPQWEDFGWLDEYGNPVGQWECVPQEPRECGVGYHVWEYNGEDWVCEPDEMPPCGSSQHLALNQFDGWVCVSNYPPGGGAGGGSGYDPELGCDPTLDNTCLRRMTPAQRQWLDSARKAFWRPPSEIADTALRARCESYQDFFEFQLARMELIPGDSLAVSIGKYDSGTNRVPGDSVRHFGLTYQGQIHFDSTLMALAMTGDSAALHLLGHTAMHEAIHLVPSRKDTLSGEPYAYRNSSGVITHNEGQYLSDYFKDLNVGPGCIKY